MGIGASAGGLEALELFLSHVPMGSGLAYVVVQHLDPNHKGMVVELLQRITPMPVLQISDRLAVLPDHVYVIPPNRDLSILHGVLHLLEPGAPRGLRLPIDFFLRALATDRHALAIGVILSGMDSDGTLGLRAIKENAGTAFVQDPATAKFDAMPRSAIDAGLADVVAAAEALAPTIVGHLQHMPVRSALTITRHLAQLMGGTAGFDSVPAQGSRFWFTAWLHQQSALAQPQPAVPAPEDAAAALRLEFAGRRVLLVEDDAVNREVAVAMLEQVGLAVDVAADGDVAVRMAARQDYALVLMDLQLPTMDGVAATKAIQAAHTGRQLPIVAMTASVFSEDRQRCLAAGMSDFLAKPIVAGALFAMLLRSLRSGSG